MNKSAAETTPTAVQYSTLQIRRPLLVSGFTSTGSNLPSYALQYLSQPQNSNPITIHQLGLV